MFGLPGGGGGMNFGLGALADLGMSAANAGFQHQLNEENRDWQKMMAKNAVSYRVEDLKNAGINPMMAAGMGLGGGLSAPSGGVGSAGGGGSATAGVRNVAEAGASRAQAELNSAAAVKARAEAAKAVSETLSPGVADEVARANVAHMQSSAAQSDATRDSARAGMGEITARIDNLRSEIDRRGLDAELARRLMDLTVEFQRIKNKGESSLLPEKAARGSAGALVKHGLDAAWPGGKWLGEAAGKIKGMYDTWMNTPRKTTFGERKRTGASGTWEPRYTGTIERK